MATAQVLFQRFYYVVSMKEVGVRDIALGAIFLASKVEEHPRRPRDILNVYDELVELEGGAAFGSVHEPDIIAGEIQILCKLGFNVQVQQPHGFMINYLRSLELTDDEELTQKAWNYMNDSGAVIDH
ncbi:cyclin-like protein [Blyttiomyces helicus]|uniref:Cyclin-like protein n=1 Tax=Blyttiomyces helicus TaxID=388810 RepID=A0A4V1IQI6_9FUNG|nr:cyclin-like protein [Blyttiomyces helicus]|eukprot:RKO86687.1 cyclin-like protein [Blyttiomyces helicus]